MSHDSPIIQIQTNVNHLCLQGLIGRHSGNKPTPPPKDRRSPITSQGMYAHLGSGNKSPLTPQKKNDRRVVGAILPPTTFVVVPLHQIDLGTKMNCLIKTFSLT